MKVWNVMMTTWWSSEKVVFFQFVKWFTSSYLPICGSISIFKHFEAWHFVSKQFHSDGHEQAAVISVAAGGVYYQEHHQEDDHDGADHTAFSHTAAAHFEGEMGESRWTWSISSEQFSSWTSSIVQFYMSAYKNKVESLTNCEEIANNLNLLMFIYVLCCWDSYWS